MDSFDAAPQRVVLSPDHLSRLAPTLSDWPPQILDVVDILQITAFIVMASALLLKHSSIHLFEELEETEPTSWCMGNFGLVTICSFKIMV